jgi:hypothetical protein
MKHWMRIGIGCSLLAAAAGASASEPETRRVVAGPQYQMGGFLRFWFGDGYRKLWTTPVELPVLRLDSEAGGLTPQFRIGGRETIGLALEGANGRSYTFRKLKKEEQRVLPRAWWGTLLGDLVEDQGSANHPAAAPIFSSLSRPLGLLAFRSRFAVMPDDPALGEFRTAFANAPGTFDEYPTPGYEGITDVVSSEDLWLKWRQGPENHVDSRQFLKARLLDLVTGNRDRRRDQWRWARVTGKALFQPVPEDFDYCFARQEGLLVDYARLGKPVLQRFSGEYPRRLDGLTEQGDHITAWLLSDLDGAAFAEVANEVKAQLTDGLIGDAVHRMPPEWYALNGETLARQIRERRDGLPSFARRFYLSLADRVDVYGTEQDDLALVQHLPDGSLEVTLSLASAPGVPYYRRRFDPKETKEVRIFLLGGNDRLLATGGKKSPITLRVLGGPGNDTLDDSDGGGAYLWDSAGQNVFTRGPGTHVDRRAWVSPIEAPPGPWTEPRGSGHWTAPHGNAFWEPDQEVMIGGGLTRTSWGFREYPWANLQDVTVLYSTGYNSVRATYAGQFRLNYASNFLGRLDLMASGVENLNYYGLGNETPDQPNSLRLTHDYTFAAFPSLRYQPNRTLELHAGAFAKEVQPQGTTSLVEEQNPYGSGNFGEAALQAGLELDTRGILNGVVQTRHVLEPGAPEWRPAVTGVRVSARGFYMPAVWDVKSQFGGVEGSVAGYVGNERVSFATRVGGRQMWGAYPWFESASIGGSANVRGYHTNRFRGDASLFGNAELRLWVGKAIRAMPMRWALIGFVDSGRVWLAGESSQRWHTDAGGGFMAHVIGTPLTLTTSVAHSSEGTLVYFRSGYSF